MKREIGDYIEDIIDAIQKIIKFIKGLTKEEFIKDDKTVFAVIRALELIGEAVKNIPQEIKIKFNEIPWKELADLRDKLIHSYFGIKLDIVWKGITEEIPPLKEKFEKLNNELEG